jgi:hypothetical protein
LRCCHTGASSTGRGRERVPASQRRAGAAGSMIPGAVLALLSKCPACLAGYLAVATGAGVSVATAAHVRTAAVIVCAVALFWLTGRVAYRFVDGRKLRFVRR